MKKKWVIIVFSLLILLIAWWVSLSFTSPEEKGWVPFYEVKKGSFLITVVEKGVLEPKEIVQVETLGLFPNVIPGRRRGNFQYLLLQNTTIASVVPAGKKVKKGDLLIELDRSEIEKGIKKAEDELEEKWPQLEAKINDLEFKKQDLAIKIQQTKLTYKKQLAALDKIYNDVTYGKISDSSLVIEEARLKLKKNKQSRRDTESEYRVVKILLEKYRDWVVSEINRLENRTGPPREISTVIPDVLKNEKSAIVDKYFRPLKNLIKQINGKQKELSFFYEWPNPWGLYAPTDGHLFHGVFYAHSRRPNPLRLKTGSTLNKLGVRANTNFLYISNKTDMNVNVQVSEININRVKKGQKVKVRPEAFPELILNGVVTEVSEVPDMQMQDRFQTGGVTKYPVTVSLQDTDERLRPQMSARVEIMCDEVKDVLFVPLEAVFEKNGKKTCYVSSQGNSLATELEIGKSNDYYVVVTKGIKEGDKVYLYNPFLKE